MSLILSGDKEFSLITLPVEVLGKHAEQKFKFTVKWETKIVKKDELTKGEVTNSQGETSEVYFDSEGQLHWPLIG